MRIEIINTGAELMLGRVLNTHHQWLAQQLANLGHTVERQVAVDDTSPTILRAVKDALAADLILVTGGLGPTSDDRTRDMVAELLGLKLHEDPAIVAHIEQFFAARHKKMPASCRVQAQVPEGAIVLPNAHGTAPGLVLATPPIPERSTPGCLIMLPGPPRELRPMFRDQVIPLLQSRFGLAPFACRTLKTSGMGESVVEEKVAGPLDALVRKGLELGYCARVGEVDLRFTARGPQAQELVGQAERIAAEILGERVYGADDDLLETVVVRALSERRQTLAVAESCTGGLVSHRLTNVPGASAVLLAGWVTYSNAAKQKLLGVRPETLAAHGAVSEATAKEMATGARLNAEADFGIAVTGIAGPTGGTAEKPVGTVWLAVSSAARVIALRCFNPFDRETFKQVSSQQILDMLRRQVMSQTPQGIG